jgi:putative FmdB family regulatory protein
MRRSGNQGDFDMPIYEYRCENCGGLFEEWTRHADDGKEERACPLCKGKARRIISNTSFALKGDGWYVTEYGTHKNRCRKEEGGCAAAGSDAGSGRGPCPEADKCAASRAEPASGTPASKEVPVCKEAPARKEAPERKEAPAAP